MPHRWPACAGLRLLGSYQLCLARNPASARSIVGIALIRSGKHGWLRESSAAGHAVADGSTPALGARSLCWRKPTRAQRLLRQRLALFPSGQQLDFISHLGSVVEMLHRFLAASGALGFFHQAHVLGFEVRQFLLHSLISRYATKGFSFYRPK